MLEQRTIFTGDLVGSRDKRWRREESGYVCPVCRCMYVCVCVFVCVCLCVFVRDREIRLCPARGEDPLPSEMSRRRRLILSIYRGRSLTQLFIRRECRLCSRGILLATMRRGRPERRAGRGTQIERGLEGWGRCATGLNSLTAFQPRAETRLFGPSVSWLGWSSWPDPACEISFPNISQLTLSLENGENLGCLCIMRIIFVLTHWRTWLVSHLVGVCLIL